MFLDAIKLKYTSHLSETIKINITSNSLKLLQELDNLKRKFQIDLNDLLHENFAQFESNAAEQGFSIEICTLGKYIVNFLIFRFSNIYFWE